MPSLKLDDGTVLTEGPAIVQYVADQKPESKLAPPHGTKARLRQDELAVFISTEIHKTYSPLFNPATPPEGRQIAMDKLATRYAMMEELLSDGRPYLTGQTFATVDAYLFTITRWAQPLNFDLSKFPNVLAFQKRVAERPAVKAALEAEGLVKAA